MKFLDLCLVVYVYVFLYVCYGYLKVWNFLIYNYLYFKIIDVSL